jgi:hypothetical protein
MTDVIRSLGVDFRGEVWKFWCPGCDKPHQIIVGPGMWGFDGNTESPTVDGSVLVHSHQTLNDAGRAYLDAGGRDLTDAHRTKTPRCHSFIRSGHIQYLADCEHELANQTVPMAPVH